MILMIPIEFCGDSKLKFKILINFEASYIIIKFNKYNQNNFYEKNFIFII